MPEGPPKILPVTERDPDRATVENVARWGLPVGEMPQIWYTYTVHDLTGEKNTGPGFPPGGYPHSGLDLNWDVEPHGDVDRGAPVFAITDAFTHRVAWHEVYRGCVILEVEHAHLPLYVRYWHLGPECMVRCPAPGKSVRSGQHIGNIGSYELGGDHLHFDMALDEFEPTWWFTKHPDVRWVDPVPILRQHCIVSELEAMLRKGDTRG